MIKTIINKAVRAVLDELFVDAPSVQLSMGADLFSDSKINLSNLTFRPDIFDISMQPFHLVHGHVGSLNVEGIAELALGGKLRFNAQNIYLFFEIDRLADPEKIQNMKKILLELQSGKFSTLILSDLLKKIQGLATSPDNDILKKRKAIYKALDYLSKGAFLTIQSIHIRFEFRNVSENGSLKSICHALGAMIPLIKIVPAPASMRPDNVPRSDPVFLFGLKSTQIYCDYQRESYYRENVQRIVDHFTAQWKQEIHSALISPFDMDFVVGLNIKRRTGLICPNVVIKFPILKISVDERQLEVLNQIAHEIVMGSKKFSHAVKVQKIFRNGFPLPRVQEVGGIRVLPHLFFKNLPYPSQYKSIPRSNGVGIVSFMKERVGARWTQMLWKHIIRLVIHDLQKARPLGRWVELVRLATIRKEYSFLYAQYYKKCGDGNYVFNPHAAIPASKVRQLFEYEMLLSEQAVAMFRSLAYMIVVAGFFYNKKRQMTAGASNSGKPPSIGEGVLGWEKIFIGWREILRIHTELFEAQRETAFHRFDRSRQEDDGDESMLWEESATVRSSEEGSVYSYSMHSMTSAKGPPSPTKLARGKLPTESTTPNSKAGSANGIQTTAKKFFGNWNFGGIASAFTPADDYDRKIMGKFDLSAFHDILGSIVDIDKKASDKDGENAFSISNDIEMALRRGPASPKAIIPEITCIAEAVQWAMLKHQDVITWMPPDINFQVEKVNVELKSPLSVTQKERIPIASIKITDLSANVNISQSSSNHTFTKGKVPSSSAVNGTPGKNSFEEQVKSLRGFASLSGALIQFRLVCRQFSIGLHLLPPAAMTTEKRTMERPLGLPSYPVGDATNQSVNTMDTALTLNRAHSSDSLHSASSSESTSIHTKGGLVDGSHSGEVVETGRVSATTISTSGDQNKDPEELQLKTIPGVNPDFKYIPGETIMESMQRIKDYKFMHGIVEKSDDEEEEGDEDDGHVNGTGGTAKGNIVGGSKGYTIDTVFDDAASSASIGKKPSIASGTTSAAGTSANGNLVNSSTIDMKDIISSAPAENAFVFCVILDLDDKGEGAGDIQLQLGGMRLDLSKRVMATLIHPSFADHFLKILKEKSAMDEVLTLLKQPMVVIDWEQNTPEVLLSCDPPLSVLDRLLEQEELSKKHKQSDSGKRPASRNSISKRRSRQILEETLVLIDDSHDTYQKKEEDANEDETDVAESLTERRKRRAAIVFNKNFMQWLAVLEASLPKILSFCVRTSPVIIQSLESTVIRDLVYAKIQSVLDRASKRRQESGIADSLPFEHILGMLSHLVMSGFDNSEQNVEFNNRVTAYRRMRRWGARAAVTSVYPRKLNFGEGGVNNGPSTPQSAFKLKLLIPAIELVLAKAVVPYPALDVHIQSMNVMKLPMSDETLCYYLAWVLAEMMPIYF